MFSNPMVRVHGTAAVLFCHLLLIAFTCCLGPKSVPDSTARVDSTWRRWKPAVLWPPEDWVWSYLTGRAAWQAHYTYRFFYSQNVQQFKSIQSNHSQNLPSLCISDFIDVLVVKKSNLNHNGCSPKQSQLHRLVQWHKVYSIWEQIGHAQ